MGCTIGTLNSYYKSPTSRAFDASRTVAECMDAILCIVASVGHLVASAFRSQGKDVPAGASGVEQKANTGRSMVSFVRAFQSMEALVTLKWFFHNGSDGTVSIKTRHDGTTYGERRHPLTMAALLSLIAGRILGFVKNFHDMAVYNLGKHAQNIGYAACGLFTALVCFGFVDAIRSYRTAAPKDCRDETANLIQNTAYLVMDPFECGIGMGAKAAPALGILGAVVSILGAIAIIATNVWQFSGFKVEARA